MDPLTRLGLKYGTDKATLHGYTYFYHRLLAERRPNLRAMLEIGIDKGASLRMWRDYFPLATVTGVDRAAGTLFQEERLQTRQLDQTDAVSLRELGEASRVLGLNTWGLIVDDGGHFMSQQQESLFALWPYLQPGGLYVIEDLNTSLESSYQDRRPTTLALLHFLDAYGELPPTVGGPFDTLEEICASVELRAFQSGGILGILRKKA